MHKGNQEKKRKIQSKLLKQYLDFLREHQCLSDSTINTRRFFISRFLSEIGGIATPSKLHKLSPKNIHDYIIKTSELLGRASKKQLVTALRSFLRFAHIYGYIKKSLSEVVPVITTRKLEGVPKKISWGDVGKLLSAPDRKTPAGRRDYAILLLLATYGVRIGQVRNLKLSDIKWHQGIIYFNPSKGGKPLSFPLEASVAKAILEYIKRDRKDAPFKKIFLTVNGSKRPLNSHNYLNSLRLYYKRAGIVSEAKGAHAIRHAFATRLMEARVPIKTISDLLGHKLIGTTFIYTKVDVERLRTLARKWPEVII